VSPPDPKAVARLLTAASEQDPELGLFLRLAVVLGARRGELVGLKWRDVDLGRGEVLIASGVVRVAGRPLIDKDTKTYAKRRVAVGASTVELLKAQRARQAEIALAAGTPLAPDAYVFARSADGGAPISPDGISHRFQQLAVRLGVRARLHDLRHFMVTQLVALRGGLAHGLRPCWPRRQSHDAGHLRPLPAGAGPQGRRPDGAPDPASWGRRRPLGWRHGARGPVRLG
jgi:integrase